MDFDVTSISAIIAAAGVLVGVVYYIMDMRHQGKVRQTDLLMRLRTITTTKEMIQAAQKFLSTDFKDYDDFVKKHGSLQSEGEVQTAYLMIGEFFEGIGVLLKNGLADIDLITQLFGVEKFWMKMKPLAEGNRKKSGRPQAWEWFEYLYNEIKKREVKGVKNG
jgi:hypothetical protein